MKNINVIKEENLKLIINEFKLFNFIDECNIDFYKLLGFKIEIDDEINKIYYIEFIDNDLLNLQMIFDECENMNLDVICEYEDKTYNFDEFKLLLN